MRRAPLALLTLVLLAAPALADGFLVPVRRDQPVRGPWAVDDHRVSISVDGQRAETEVRQTFVNLTRGALEVEYLFPVPEGAVIEGFSLVVGGREMEGRLLPKERAMAIYERIVRSKRDPGLLTYAGRGLVKTSVFPIPAGGKREVVVRYSELLRRDGDLVKLVYPLDTERFSAKPIRIVDVKADIRNPAPIKAVYSPTHEIRVERKSERHATARWSRETFLPDRDLVLYYSVGGRDVGASLLSYRPEGADAGHFLLLLNPKATVDEADVAGKNLTVVLDHSGSMKGEKIEQAKEALRYVLHSLSAKDRLNVVAFSSTAESLFDGPRPVTEEVRDTALAFVDRLAANGGTDIHSALKAALAGTPAAGERRNAILFLTDGLPTVGVQDTAKIARDVKAANESRKDARLFVFGVGYDVNAAFLDRLVDENGGISENVRPKESVEIAVTSLYEKIRHAVLTDLLLKIDGVEVFDTYPRRLPDLFAGSQIAVSGRYRGGGAAATVLAGRTPAGKRAFRFPLRFEVGSDPDEKPFVARIWATNKIGYLMDQMRVMGRREKELVDEIVRLSVRYGIVTEYTAFLADEENSLHDFDGNVRRAREETARKLAEVTGGSGTNQADNLKRMRGRQTAQSKSRWFDERGELVEVETVRSIGRKTFYRRRGVWLDADVGPDEEPDEVVVRLSDRFFELVRSQKSAENRWVAFRAPVVVRIGGRVVRFEPAE